MGPFRPATFSFDTPFTHSTGNAPQTAACHHGTVAFAPQALPQPPAVTQPAQEISLATQAVPQPRLPAPLAQPTLRPPQGQQPSRQEAGEGRALPGGARGALQGRLRPQVRLDAPAGPLGCTGCQTMKNMCCTGGWLLQLQCCAGLLASKRLCAVQGRRAAAVGRGAAGGRRRERRRHQGRQPAGVVSLQGRVSCQHGREQ